MNIALSCVACMSVAAICIAVLFKAKENETQFMSVVLSLLAIIWIICQ